MTVKFIVTFLLITACGTSPVTPTMKPNTDTQTNPPPPPPRNSAVEVTFHNGPILSSGEIKAIFWGSSWYQGEKYNGIQTFLEGFPNSNYLAIAEEYNINPNQFSYVGSTWDLSAAPSILSTDSNTLAQKACQITGYQPDSNTVYMFYTDTPPGDNKDCAWHSSFWCQRSGGNKVYSTMIYIPNLDDVEDCQVSDIVSSHSPGLATAANVSAHELMETVTDPYGTGWYDSESTKLCSDGQNCEIGDRCVWTFGNKLVSLSNGSQWKLQMEWSNKAYEDKTGNSNVLGQYGCVTGE